MALGLVLAPMLAIIPALTITCAGDRYAIPQVSLVELVRLEAGQTVALPDWPGATIGGVLASSAVVMTVLWVALAAVRTLKRVDGKPVVELDDGTVVTQDAAGIVVVTPPPS